MVSAQQKKMWQFCNFLNMPVFFSWNTDHQNAMWCQCNSLLMQQLAQCAEMKVVCTLHLEQFFSLKCFTVSVILYRITLHKASSDSVHHYLHMNDHCMALLFDRGPLFPPSHFDLRPGCSMSLIYTCVLRFYVTAVMCICMKTTL